MGLSFDVDTELVWLEDRDVQSPSTMSRGEYGARAGLPRVLALLSRHDIPATFFIPAMSMELHPAMVRLIKTDPRHEFGFHSYAHENPLRLNAEDERAAYEKGLEIFVSHTGVRPQGFRSAAWDLTPATIDIVRSLGFVYDSSLMADDRPYQLLSRGQDAGLIELPVEWILDDAPLFNPQGNSYSSPRDVMQVWIDEFDRAWEERTMFLLTMHPHIVGHRSRIVALQGLIDHIQARGGAWFATHEAAARYVREQAGMGGTASPSGGGR